MRDSYTKQGIIVVAIVAGALALVIGFVAGALLTMPDRQKTQAVIKDVQAELKAKTAELNRLKVTKDQTIVQLRAKSTELNQRRAANDKTITQLRAKITELKELRIPKATKAIKTDQITTSHKSSSDSPDVGEQGYLQGEYIFGPQNSKCVPMSTTREILDRYVDALISNDVTGVANLYLTGEIFPVSDGTRILRLSAEGSMWSNLYKRKVRILSGEHTGKIAWVGSDWVKK